MTPMMAAADPPPIHPIGWVLIILAGLFVLGLAGLIIHSALSNRRPNPRNPAQMLRHHVKLLMPYAGGDPGFPAQARRFAEFFRDLVPPVGCATSLQGEVIRSVDRLASEERRNGNLNWGKGYAQFIRFLRETLLDTTVFDEAALARISESLDAVSKHGRKPQDEDRVRIAFAELIKAAVAYADARPEPMDYAGTGRTM